MDAVTRAWVDQHVLTYLRELFTVHGEPVSVDMLEFHLGGLSSAPDGFLVLDELVRKRGVFDSLRTLVERGQAKRVGTYVGQTIPEATFTPSSLLDALAEA